MLLHGLVLHGLELQDLELPIPQNLNPEHNKILQILEYTSNTGLYQYDSVCNCQYSGFYSAPPLLNLLLAALLVQRY